MQPSVFLDGKVALYQGNCRDRIRELADNSIDSVVTDPPYALVSIGKRFEKEGAAACKVPEGKSGAYARASAGFMGKQWDTGETAFAAAFWAEVLRVLKPGGHAVAFSGTRTYHRMACAIEDAGFEIRDQLAWTYGSGFPKSHNQRGGLGTALKPAWEPIVLARKPLIGTVAENLDAHGTGAINIDGCRVAGESTRRVNAAEIGYHGRNLPGTYTTGSDAGRWPANIIHDGSDEVLAAFPDAPGQQRYVGPEHGDRPSKGIYGDFGARPENQPRNHSGSAARFFYCAKADADDRLASKHPTVKPVDLMQWLVRLVTPKGGLVLDPFAGTGTTGEAAFREGMRAILIEREEEYQADIQRRMGLVLAGPDEKRAALTPQAKAEDLPLFAETGTPIGDLANRVVAKAGEAMRK